MLVKPTGSKLWRVKYRIHGREKALAVGAYPAVDLAHARRRRDEARGLSPKSLPATSRACTGFDANVWIIAPVGRETGVGHR
ncbi:Arm DNA-binding domain-containing protein [Novosphingobium album (ex Hu et al. 2023)]|uniref:Arm DNA-binding domain-containing protein n=1 Tax=Novosphingobium album (ex Hu et al. 2023) TaxID=2930093 RepID=UPI002E135A21